MFTVSKTKQRSRHHRSRKTLLGKPRAKAIAYRMDQKATSEVIKQLFPEAREREEVALYGHEEKIQQYLELDARVKELTQERDAIKQELQLALADAEIGRARGYIVEWKNQTRQALDTARLKKEQAEIYANYLKPAQTVRVFKIRRFRKDGKTAKPDSASDS